MISNAFSLRGHDCSVVALEICSDASQKYIVSADSSGLVIRWDLTLKRKVYAWQAHSDSILTLQSLGDSHILTHSRDSHLRIWHLLAGSAVEIFELPVNTLNFCNVVSFGEYLVTPATTNSNNFDIYKLVDDTVTRVVTNFSAYDLYVKENRVVSFSNSESGRNDFGIIMKLDFIEDENILSLGFESGHVVVVKIDFESASSNVKLNSHGIDRSIINKGPKISLVYATEAHIPNPVTTLIHDTKGVISGSTNKKILVHDINTDLSQYTVIKSATAGIRAICTIPNSQALLVGHWNGTIEAILDSKQLFEVKRDIPAVNIVTSASNTETKRINAVKLTSMTVSGAESQPVLSNSYKSRALSRRTNSEKTFVYAGFEDGLILAYYLDGAGVVSTQ